MMIVQVVLIHLMTTCSMKFLFMLCSLSDHKHDYLRVNIEDLSESQCEAMFR